MRMRTGRGLVRLLFVLALLVAGVTPLALAATGTTITLAIMSSGSAVSTVAAGSVVTLTASVNSGNAAVTTGQVNFCDAAATYCTDIHLLATAQLTSAGTAVTKFIPGTGNYSYKAIFAGTSSNSASSSSTSSLTVTGTYPTVTTLTESGSAGNYTLTASVAGAGTTAPSGEVSFVDTANNNNLLNPATLNASTAGLNFVDASSPSTGASPYSLVVADLNGDGIPDIVTVNGAGTLTVLLANGYGTFRTGTTPTIDFTPSAIAVGDFNMDGKPDLAVGHQGSPLVGILLGNGDGTFTAVSSQAMAGPDGTAPGLMIVGDVNGDGKPDLLVATDRTEEGAPTGIQVVLGNGDGTFTPVANQIEFDDLTAMTIGDFNGDGILDVVADSSLTYVNVVLLGNGDGTFTAKGSLMPADAGQLVAADFNGDGKLDLAVISGTPTAVTVLLGQGDGTFEAAASTAIPSSASMAAGDFNGDGKPDLAIADDTDNTVIVLLGVGDGTFTTGATVAAGNLPNAVAVADFNGDGHPDIGTANANSNAVTILLTESSVATARATGVSVAGSGIHQVQAAYSGDSAYASSQSNTVGLTASASAPITLSVLNHTYGDPPFTVAATSNSTGAFTYSVVSGPATIAGSSVTLAGAGIVVVQASQAAADSYQAATQTASFAVGPAALAIAANNMARVFGTANPAFTGTLVGAVNGDSFTESFTTPATAASIVGSYLVVPSVTGANIASYTVTATSGTLTVSQAGTATTFALSNENNTLTATVTSLTSGTPTGTVAFYEGQTEVGTGTLSNGTASYTTSSFPAGDVVVSAQYSGDANFTQSASPPILVMSVVPANSSLTVESAGSVTDSVKLSPAPGYTGTVQLSCINLPANATCSFQPSSVAFTGTNNAASVEVTIQTGVSSQAQLRSLPVGDGDPGSILAAVFWLPGVLTAVFTGRRKARTSRIYQALSLLLLLCGISALSSACGGGSSSSAPTSSQTTAGTYSVQLIVSGPGGLSQNIGVTLTVQ